MTLAKKLGHPATIADLEALPATTRGEIIDGELYALPRPRALHANVEGELIDGLRGPFQKGRRGPGGWWILAEPGIEVPRSPEFSPDLGGWRRERMPHLPKDTPIRIVPDWICEILSPSSRGYDLVVKRRFYAELGVRHLWYVDLEARALTVSRLAEGNAVELDLAEWWEGTEEVPE